MQSGPRLYLFEEQTALQGNAAIAMREDQAHYLGRVMRRVPGDTVHLFNARDGEWRAAIDSLPKRGGGSFIVGARLRAPEAEDGPILLFAPLKRDATDLVVRMATELGVSAIRPVLTERTNTGRVNTDRLRLIAIEAAEQCERLSVPPIAEPERLATVLSEWPESRTLWAAIERSGDDDRHTKLPTRPPAAGALLIGPEGGFAPSELDVLRARHFVTPISLGSRILKAETAVVAGLACLQAARERWGFEISPITGNGHPGPFPPAMSAERDVQPR